MAIEPTGLSDILLTPDVSLDRGNNASGQDFSQFFSALSSEDAPGAAADGIPSDDVGNPTPAQAVSVVPALQEGGDEIADNPVQALMMIADRLGLMGRTDAAVSEQAAASTQPDGGYAALMQQGNTGPSDAGKEAGVAIADAAAGPLPMVEGVQQSSPLIGQDGVLDPPVRHVSATVDKAQIGDGAVTVSKDADSDSNTNADTGVDELAALAAPQTGMVPPADITGNPIVPIVQAAMQNPADVDATVGGGGQPEAKPETKMVQASVSAVNVASIAPDEAKAGEVGEAAAAPAPSDTADKSLPANGRQVAARHGNTENGPANLNRQAELPDEAMAVSQPVQSHRAEQPEQASPVAQMIADLAQQGASGDAGQNIQPQPVTIPSGHIQNPPAHAAGVVQSAASQHQQVLDDLLVGNSVEDQWVDRISKDIQVLISSDNREARLHLRPRELGDMLVKLEMNDGQVKVHFTVETAAAQSLISDATSRLQAMMENRGFKLDQASVDVGSGGTGKGGAGSNAGGNEHQDAQTPFMARAQPAMLEAAVRRASRATAFERYA